MNRKRKSQIERLEKQKIARRQKYSEIKQDPVLYELAKEKEKLRYKERKKKQQIKSVHEESPRVQREKRKKWREASKKYRQKQKDALKNEPVIPEVVLVKAADTDKDEILADTEDTLTLKAITSPETKIRKIRYLEYKKRKNLINIIKKLKAENKMLLNKLQEKKKDAKINAKELDKKAKIKKERKGERSSEDNRIKLLVKKVRAFYEEDANSTVTSGKKQYITRNKIQKQKRYMTSSQKHLHKQFMSKYQVKISFTFFCKHRPFWVLKPNSSQRDTCLCTLHENINLQIQALKGAAIINEPNSDALMTTVCCSTYDLNCLKRKCLACKNKTVNINDFTNDQNLVYYKWVRAKEYINIKKGKKVITITKKVQIIAKPREVVNALLVSLPDFFEHCYRILNQYTVMKQLKDTLNINCAVIHADFSENYELKFHKEVQSMHFGGSRKAVCLHTAVIYSFDFAFSSVKPISVSTASSCLRHDAPAVWAHMIPLIQKVVKNNPFIDTLHFQTDSPVSQYRNKYIFYMISQLYKEFPQITSVTWNYSEAGHGKGAPDGVGATIKRTVDSYVNHGIDVGSYDKFIQLVQENIDNVVIIDVPEKNIKEIEEKILDNLPTFRGTLAVHQVLWKKGIAHLTFRSASCFDCNYEMVCEHGKHLGFLKLPPSDLLPPTATYEEHVVPLISTKTSAVLKNITNVSSKPSASRIVTVAGPSNIQILSSKKIIIRKAENQ